VPEALRAYKAEPYAYGEARELADELDLSEPVAIALVRRGYRTSEEARAFLELAARVAEKLAATTKARPAPKIVIE